MNGVSTCLTGPDVSVRIGAEAFPARLERNLAPHACGLLQELSHIRVELIHARWSGEACWAPLKNIWPPGLFLPEDHAIDRPEPGQILLYAGGLSEPELLFPYGPTRFASRAGPLMGNLVLTIEGRLARLAEIGREILWGGAMTLCIDFAERVPRSSSPKSGISSMTGLQLDQ